MQERKIDTLQPVVVAPDSRENTLPYQKRGSGSIKMLKGDFTENSVAQWALPSDFSVWKKIGPHLIEVLDEKPDGQPELPDFPSYPGEYTGRGLLIFVVREGHEKEDRNVAWDAYEADPDYRHWQEPERWLGHWVRFAAVTPVIEGKEQG